MGKLSAELGVRSGLSQTFFHLLDESQLGEEVLLELLEEVLLLGAGQLIGQGALLVCRSLLVLCFRTHFISGFHDVFGGTQALRLLFVRRLYRGDYRRSPLGLQGFLEHVGLGRALVVLDNGGSEGDRDSGWGLTVAMKGLELKCTQLPKVRQVHVRLEQGSVDVRLLELMLPDLDVRPVVAVLLRALSNRPGDLRHLSCFLSLAGVELMVNLLHQQRQVPVSAVLALDLGQELAHIFFGGKRLFIHRDCWTGEGVQEVDRLRGRKLVLGR